MLSADSNSVTAFSSASPTATRSCPPTTFLRASDALHLACAAEHDFSEIYSNDRHFLAAAPLFGLKPVNLIV